MIITEADYDVLLKLVTDIAIDVARSMGDKIHDDPTTFHDRVFADVLKEVDDFHPDLSKYEAADISEVCGEVEHDILHSDILGDF
jgi:hypothetical protein